MTLHMNGDLKYECNEAIEKIIDKAYKRGYEDGKKVHEEVRNKDMDYGYEKGLEDAWECSRKIAKQYIQMLKSLFGTVDISKIFLEYTVTEVMQKLQKYEMEPFHVSCDDCIHHIVCNNDKKYICDNYETRNARYSMKERKCETCGLFLKDCIGAVMLDGCDKYEPKQNVRGYRRIAYRPDNGGKLYRLCRTHTKTYTLWNARRK